MSTFAIKSICYSLIMDLDGRIDDLDDYKSNESFSCFKICCTVSDTAFKDI